MLKLLCKQAKRSISHVNDTNTSNIQIRMLTQGLGTYSVKRQLMNTQD